MDYQKIINEVTKQEEMLRFDHFTNDDAWALGKHLVEKVEKDGIKMAISIRKLNGNCVFAYFSEGTNLMNENWMRRKYNTVKYNEMSSFKQWAIHTWKGRTPEDTGLKSEDFAFCGGGFPIKLKSGEMVAALTVSNLPHEKDHKFIIDGLASFLNVTDVPEIVLE